MEKLITGIHHVTALAGDPQKNVNFYAGILGLRLIKRTVNFDAPEVYHFYYGDEYGMPGSILTFFPYPGIAKGRKGWGMANVISFSVQADGLEYWESRLSRFNIPFHREQSRFDETVIGFEDHDGLRLELVFNDNDKRPVFTYGYIPTDFGIKGFYGVEIWEERYERTAAALTGLLDHKQVAQEGSRFRYATVDSPGNYIDIVSISEGRKGLGGGGTVHHIAFAVPDHESQEKAHHKIMEGGLNPTSIVDRQYFQSIYFREPGGALFELATAGPGFAIDEPVESLGESLKLPPQYEPYRDRLEKTLHPINLNPSDYR